MKHSTLWGFIFALPAAISFYVLPMISKQSAYSVAVLTVIVPVIAAVASFFFGMRHGRDFSVAAATVLMLFPSIFVYYDSSSCVYIIAYGAISAVCAGIGSRFHKEK